MQQNYLSVRIINIMFTIYYLKLITRINPLPLLILYHYTILKSIDQKCVYSKVNLVIEQEGYQQSVSSILF